MEPGSSAPDGRGSPGGARRVRPELQTPPTSLLLTTHRAAEIPSLFPFLLCFPRNDPPLFPSFPFFFLTCVFWLARTWRDWSHPRKWCARVAAVKGATVHLVATEEEARFHGEGKAATHRVSGKTRRAFHGVLRWPSLRGLWTERALRLCSAQCS